VREIRDIGGACRVQGRGGNSGAGRHLSLSGRPGGAGMSWPGGIPETSSSGL
jgi:hypothetical protein